MNAYCYNGSRMGFRELCKRCVLLPLGMDSKFIHGGRKRERDSVCPVIDRIENVAILPLSSDVSVFCLTCAYAYAAGHMVAKFTCMPEFPASGG